MKSLIVTGTQNFVCFRFSPFKGTQDWDFFASSLKFVMFLCYLCENIKILHKIFFWFGQYWRRYDFSNEKNVWARSKKFYLFFSLMNPLHEPIQFFQNSIHELRQGWLYVLILAKMLKFILLSLRLSGIEFSLVSD